MDPFVGEIKLIGWNWVPDGWALCDGSLLNVSTYPALFALLGTQYGGNGSTTFALPDLRSRVPFGASLGTPPVSLPPLVTGHTGGAAVVNVPLPSHTHVASATSTGGSPAVNSTGSIAFPATTSSTGSTNTPSANSIFAPSTDSAVGAAVNIYSPAASTTTLKPVSVSVSGNVSFPTTNVVVGPAGVPSAQIDMHPPYVAMMYIIALVGIFPSRP